MERMMQEMISRTNCSTLNLAVDRQYEYLMERFGGEQNVSSRYPEVYKRIKYIQDQNREGRLLDDKTILEIPEPATHLVDAVYLPAVYYANKTLTVYYAASFYEIPKAAYLTLKVLDASGMIVKRQDIDPEKPGHFISGKFEFKDLNVDNGYQVLLEHYVTLPGKDLSLTLVRETIRTDPVFAERAMVEAPRKLSDAPSEIPDERQIRAFYDRYPFRPSEKDVDYVYEDAYDHKNNVVNVKLEAAGNITLSKEIEKGSFEDGDDIAIMDFGCGAVKYTSEGASLNIRDKKFTWLFKPEWNAKIPSKYYYSETVVNLSYKLGFFPRGETAEYVLYLTSFLDKDMGNSCRKIRKLHIQIGCVAEHTLVSMADGRKLEIENVRVGDRIIASADNSTGEVVNTWTGRESRMHCIRTLDGHELLVTGSHYVLTDEGMVMAERIHLGMKIVMENGVQEKIRELYTVEEEVQVYNLSVRMPDGGLGCMVCGGMVLADNDYFENPPAEICCSGQEDEYLKELAELMKERR